MSVLKSRSQHQVGQRLGNFQLWKHKSAKRKSFYHNRVWNVLYFRLKDTLFVKLKQRSVNKRGFLFANMTARNYFHRYEIKRGTKSKFKALHKYYRYRKGLIKRKMKKKRGNFKVKKDFKRAIYQSYVLSRITRIRTVTRKYFRKVRKLTKARRYFYLLKKRRRSLKRRRKTIRVTTKPFLHASKEIHALRTLLRKTRHKSKRRFYPENLNPPFAISGKGKKNFPTLRGRLISKKSIFGRSISPYFFFIKYPRIKKIRKFKQKKNKNVFQTFIYDS